MLTAYILWVNGGLVSVKAHESIFGLQESFSLTSKYQISVPKDDSERVDSLRFSWDKLNTLAVSIYWITHVM